MLRIMLVFLLLLVPGASLRAQQQKGVVFVVGGAGSIMNLAGMTRWAMKQRDIPHEVRAFDWSHGKGRVIRDIQDTRHLLDKANELAQQILSYQADHPDRPIYLIGRSTGALIVLLAAEKLPLQSLERIILLSPAVSPGYDLAPAFKSVRTEIVSFYSDYDILVLKWGTSVVGTADRFYTSSAGLHGFTLPDPSSPQSADYTRLRQIPWSFSNITTGHLGGHLGNGSPWFLKKEVTPWLQETVK